MSLDNTHFEDLFLQRIPLIDLRAPCEFQLGSIPGAVNLPLMTDSERAAVGTCYKQQGREAAIQLGHSLVSGDIREQRMQLWQEFIRQNPRAILFCFRGGLRSQTVQKWLIESGYPIEKIEGGYKKLRRFLTTQIESLEDFNLRVVAGMTGAGKTQLLNDLPTDVGSLDLEKYARHRGSAFGHTEEAQPTQINFENDLGVQILKHRSRKFHQLYVEDESRLIGRVVIPENIFVKMRKAPLVFIEEPMEVRVHNILQDYIVTFLQSADAETLYLKYTNALTSIARKLGGTRTTECLQDLKDAHDYYLTTKDPTQHQIWIEKLLKYYYDPLYLQSLEKRQPEIIFRGSYLEAKNFVIS